MFWISSTNILNNTCQPLLTNNTFIVQVSINLVLCSLKCKYIAVKCALSGIKSETQLHPQPYAENQSGHHIVAMTYIELRRSLWARKSHCFPTSKTRITMPARNGQHTEQYATFCTLEWGHFYCSLCWASLAHPREGVLLPGSIFGHCCTKFALLQRGVWLDLNCVCTWTGSVWSGLGFFFRTQGWKIWHWFFVGPCLWARTMH